MAEIINFRGVTRIDLPPNRILESAQNHNLTDVVVAGFDEFGEFFCACSMADGGDALWLLETAKVRLLQAGRIIPSSEE